MYPNHNKSKNEFNIYFKFCNQKQYTDKSDRTTHGFIKNETKEDEEKDIKVIFQRQINLKEILIIHSQKIHCLAVLSTQTEKEGKDETSTTSTTYKRIPLSVPEKSKLRKLHREESKLKLEDIELSELKYVVKEKQNDITPILKRISARKIDIEKESEHTDINPKSELHLERNFGFKPASKNSYDSVIKFIEDYIGIKYHVKIPRKKPKIICTRNTCPCRKWFQTLSANSLNAKRKLIRCPYILNRKVNQYLRQNIVANRRYIPKPCRCADKENAMKTRSCYTTSPCYVNKTNKKQPTGEKCIQTNPVPCTKNICQCKKMSADSLKIKHELNEKLNKIRCPYILNRKGDQSLRKNNIVVSRRYTPKPCRCADKVHATKTRCCSTICLYVNNMNKKQPTGCKCIQTNLVPKPCNKKYKKCNITEKFKSTGLLEYKRCISKRSFFEKHKNKCMNDLGLNLDKNICPNNTYNQKKKRSPFIIQTFNDQKYDFVKPNEFKRINDRVSVKCDRNIIITVNPKRFAKVFNKTKSTAEKSMNTNDNYYTYYPMREIRNKCEITSFQ